jgi:hypothetical protein
MFAIYRENVYYETLCVSVRLCECVCEGGNYHHATNALRIISSGRQNVLYDTFLCKQKISISSRNFMYFILIYLRLSVYILCTVKEDMLQYHARYMFYDKCSAEIVE